MSCFTSTWKNSKEKKKKKTLKFYLEFNFISFQNPKKEEIIIDCYNIFGVGINIIEFYVKIISDLNFTIILYLNPHYKFLEGEHWDFLF